MISEIIEGLLILSKYRSADVSAEHDIIHVSVDPDIMTIEDKQRLSYLGWNINEYDDGFIKWV